MAMRGVSGVRGSKVLDSSSEDGIRRRDGHRRGWKLVFVYSVTTCLAKPETEIRE